MSSNIKSITLHYPEGHAPASMENEQKQAIHDLCAEGVLHFSKDKSPPYHIDLSIQNKHLVLKAMNDEGAELPQLILSLSPYRSIIKDYFLMIESYERARHEGSQMKLEPIDMARRGLHNEAAELMIERLKDKAIMDHNTARRLFTLVCVLHMDQARLWQG